jgi:hypothetical protein
LRVLIALCFEALALTLVPCPSLNEAGLLTQQQRMAERATELEAAVAGGLSAAEAAD